MLRIVSKVSKLKKMPNSEQKDDTIESFLGAPYSLPEIFPSEVRVAMPKQYSTCSSCSSCTEVEILKSVNVKLCKEIDVLTDQASSLMLSFQKFVKRDTPLTET